MGVGAVDILRLLVLIVVVREMLMLREESLLVHVARKAQQIDCVRRRGNIQRGERGSILNSPFPFSAASTAPVEC